MIYDFGTFENKLKKLNLILTNEMKEQFSVYYDLLIEWNKKMNLTAITAENYFSAFKRTACRFLK